MKVVFTIMVATVEHVRFSETISFQIAQSAHEPGTGIAKRDPEYIANKIKESKAMIALNEKGNWAGFCYIETWDNSEYVVNSGLIIAPEFRNKGLGRAMKQHIFNLSRKRFPHAKIFGLTTSRAVMKINTDLGYEPTIYPTLPQDPAFWQGCNSCDNFEILQSKGCKNCLCTAMIFDPEEASKEG